MRKGSRLITACVILLMTGCAGTRASQKDVTFEDAGIYIDYLEEKETGRDLERMEESIRTLLERYPRSEQLLTDLLAIQADQQQYKEALTTANRFLALYPDNRRMLHVKASLEEFVGKSPVKTYEKLHELEPGNEFFLLKLADLNGVEGNMKASFRAYEKLVREFPRKEQYLARALHLFYVRKAWNEMLDLRDLYPGEGANFHDKIIELFAVKNDAPGLWQFLQEISPRLEMREKAPFYFALFYLTQDESIYEKEAAVLKKNLKNELYFFLGAYIMESDDETGPVKGSVLLQHVSKRSPYFGESMVYLMKSDIQREDKESLVAHYRDFRKTEYEMPAELSLLYYAYEKKPGFAEYLYQIFDFSPLNRSTLAGFIDILVSREYLEQARAYGSIVEGLFQSAEERYSYHYAMLRLYARLEDKDHMDIHFDKAVEQGGRLPDLLNYYGFSLLLLQPPRVEEALPLLEEAYAADPANPAVADSLGWAYFLSGKEEKGEKLIDEALKDLPDDEEILFHKAMIMKRKGLFEDALEILKRIDNEEGNRKIYYEDLDDEMDQLRSLIEP